MVGEPMTRRPFRGPVTLLLTAVLLGTVVALSPGMAWTQAAQAAQGPAPSGGPAQARWLLTFAEEFNQPTVGDLLRNGRWRSGWWGNVILTWPFNRAETALYDRRLL